MTLSLRVVDVHGHSRAARAVHSRGTADTIGGGARPTRRAATTIPRTTDRPLQSAAPSGDAGRAPDGRARAHGAHPARAAEPGAARIGRCSCAHLDAAIRRRARRSSSASCRSPASSRAATSAPRSRSTTSSRSRRSGSSRRSTASTPSARSRSPATPSRRSSASSSATSATGPGRCACPRDLQELALKVDRTVGELSRDLHRPPVGAARSPRRVGVHRGAGARGARGRRRLPRDVARRRRGGTEDEAGDTLGDTVGTRRATASRWPRTARRSPGCCARSRRASARCCACASRRTSRRPRSASASASRRCRSRASSASRSSRLRAAAARRAGALIR